VKHSVVCPPRFPSPSPFPALEGKHALPSNPTSCLRLLQLSHPENGSIHPEWRPCQTKSVCDKDKDAAMSSLSAPLRSPRASPTTHQVAPSTLFPPPSATANIETAGRTPRKNHSYAIFVPKLSLGATFSFAMSDSFIPATPRGHEQPITAAHSRAMYHNRHPRSPTQWKSHSNRYLLSCRHLRYMKIG
jgi:hypothetical protein